MKSAFLTALITFALSNLGLVVGAGSSAYAHEVLTSEYWPFLGNTVELTNACLTESEVRTIKPVPKCLKMKTVQVYAGEGGTYTDYVCAKWGAESTSRPRAFTRTTCAAWTSPRNSDSSKIPQCTKTITVDDFMPDTILVQIETFKNGDSTSDWPGRVAKFTFPRCK